MKSPRNLISLLILLAVTAFAYRHALENEFYWDDRVQVLEGKLLDSWKNLPTIFSTEVWHNVDLGERTGKADIDTYRPLFNTSLLLDKQMWEAHPRGFHLTNLLLHLGVVLLFFTWLSSMGLGTYALVGALFFALHPLAATPAHYVSARADSLATGFGLLFFLLARNSRSTWRASLAGLVLLASLLSKESGIAFAIAGFLMFRLPEAQNHSGKSFQRFLMLVFPLVVYFGARYFALGVGKEVQGTTHFWQMLTTLPLVVWRFLQCLVFPSDVMPMYDLFHRGEPHRAWAALTLLLLPSLIVLFWRRPSWATWGVLWFLISLGLTVMATARTGLVHSFYFYTPFMGLVFIVMHTWQKFGSSRLRTFSGVLALLLLAFAFFFNQRLAPNFRTEIAFYESILRAGPHAVEADFNLGNAWARHGNWKQATHQYEMAWAGGMNLHPPLHNNLGVAHLNLNQPELAEAQFQICVDRAPQQKRYWYNLFLAQWAQGKLELGLQSLRRALAVPHPYPSAWQQAHVLCASSPPAEEVAKFCQDLGRTK